MSKMPERRPDRAAHAEERFDGASARQILQRAAEEQHRLDDELASSYSLAELDEMAAEAGISRAALRAAVEAHRRDAGSATARSGPANERPYSGPLAALARYVSRNWSPNATGAAVATLGVLVFLGFLLTLPVTAPALFWVALLSLILLSLLVLLGLSPF